MMSGPTIAQTGGSTSVAETGSTDTFTVVLNAQPASNVVFSVSSSDTRINRHQYPLTFTNVNWNTGMTVTKHVDDNIIDGSVNSTLTISIIDASDNDFDPVADQDCRHYH